MMINIIDKSSKCLYLTILKEAVFSMVQLETQPLLESSKLKVTYQNNTVRQLALHERACFHPWNEQALKINHLDWINANLIANDYGYNLDNIIAYLISQAHIKTDVLTFEIDPNHPKFSSIDHQEFKDGLIKFGRQPRFSDPDLKWLKELESVAGFCTVGEFINAITHQLVTTKKVQLFIDQDPEAQNRFSLINNNYPTPDWHKFNIQKAEFVTDNGNLVIKPKGNDNHE